MIRADGNFETFRQIVAKLRAPDGCPWDRAQTHESLKPTCIEEAAEVVCGINILSRTGSADNLKEYLAFDKIIACGGSWMVKDSLINAGKFDEIRVLTAEAVSLARA